MPEKRCPICGNDFTPREYLHCRLRAYVQTETCSVRCRNTLVCRRGAPKLAVHFDAIRGTGEKSPYVKRGNRHEHRVVAEKMIGRPLRSDEIVHHKNRNSKDNRPENLEVMSRAEHVQEHRDEFIRLGEKHPHSKLTEEQVRSIRKEYAAGGVKQADLGDRYGVSQTVVSAIVRGKTWRHLWGQSR